MDEEGGMHFRPKKCQSDGSIWLHESVVGNGQIPPNINVLKERDVKTISFRVEGPEGLEPSFIKILLGSMYAFLGVKVLESVEFEPLRQCLVGPMPSSLQCWWPLPADAPIPVRVWEDSICYEAVADQYLRGQVNLFGKLVMYLEVPGFRHSIAAEERCIIYPNPQVETLHQPKS